MEQRLVIVKVPLPVELYLTTAYVYRIFVAMALKSLLLHSYYCCDTSVYTEYGLLYSHRGGTSGRHMASQSCIICIVKEPLRTSELRWRLDSRSGGISCTL